MKNLIYKLENLKKAFARLEEVSNFYDGTNDMIRDSLIQRFEFVAELTHKTLNETLRYMGVNLENRFPRTIYKYAYQNFLIDDENLWLALIQDRNCTSHMYAEEVAINLARKIQNQYIPIISKLICKIEEIIA
ncbi:MAG: nucleotidyltransferase [Epulopiscium sp. Nele67-Bin005]|nr:MAG: nucleotidyltransferase [Epulopiscium sp. Nele67-Bin005]